MSLSRISSQNIKCPLLIFYWWRYKYIYSTIRYNSSPHYQKLPKVVTPIYKIPANILWKWAKTFTAIETDNKVIYIKSPGTINSSQNASEKPRNLLKDDYRPSGKENYHYKNLRMDNKKIQRSCPAIMQLPNQAQWHHLNNRNSTSFLLTITAMFSRCVIVRTFLLFAGGITAIEALAKRKTCDCHFSGWDVVIWGWDWTWILHGREWHGKIAKWDCGVWG